MTIKLKKNWETESETERKDKVEGITVIRRDNKAKFPHWHRFPLHEKLTPKPKKEWETRKKKTYPDEDDAKWEKGRDKNYSFGRIPRADERKRAINVRNKVPSELVNLHLERDVELATRMVEPVTPFLAPFLLVLRCPRSHISARILLQWFCKSKKSVCLKVVVVCVDVNGLMDR